VISPPRDADYGPLLREAEEVVSSPEWEGAGLPPQAARAELFPSDPRAAFVLLNEARYLAIQGAFGVRRDQVNLMTLLAAMMVGGAVHTKAQRVRRRLRGTTRTDVILADGVMNALGRQIAGPSAGQIPFIAPLVGTAFVGSVTWRVVRRSAQGTKAASHAVAESVRDLLRPQAELIRRARVRVGQAAAPGEHAAR
jgi:hypothetical protein